MNNEGYVKYTADHTPGAAMTHPLWPVLNNARTRLYDLGLIGVLPSGIGFGNVSIRVTGDEFLISGTATGAKRELSPDDYCLVAHCDIDGNRVTSMGPIQASSESMSHGAIYRVCPKAACVIHVHSRAVFEGMLRDKLLSTPKSAAYGTPEMARAIGDAVSKTGNACGQIVLAGHDEGVITWGVSVAEAFSLTMALYNGYNSSNNP